jgi:ParB family chromosome partitioning protein
MSNIKKIKTGLGKGLGALIPSVHFKADEGFSVGDENENRQRGLISEVDIDKVVRNPYQPRQDFDLQALEDLKNSILKHGVIQPITVRKVEIGYELISGERRLRASKEAGMVKIPAYVMVVNTDFQMLELALIENLQREDLNPIEVANGYQRLIEECSYTQEQVADRVGKERSTVTNFLRLLKLPEKIQDYVRIKKFTMGHARALLALSDHAKMIWAGEEIINKTLSVRATESLVKQILAGELRVTPLPLKKKVIGSEISPDIISVLNDKADGLRRLFGTQVKILPKSKTSGIIEFEFYSPDDLERLIDIFENMSKS